MTQEHRPPPMQAVPSPAIRQRQVFYIPGYDPFHPRRYRELYRKHSAEQGKISGYDISLTPGRNAGRYGWQVSSRQDNIDIRTDIEVLVWSDIVRASMKGSIIATYGQLVRTVWAYLWSGAFFRLMRLRRGPILAALYPVVVLILQLLIGIAIGAAGAACFVALLPADLIAIPAIWPAIMVGVILVGTIVTLDWFRRHDRWFYAYYLMHDYAFTARWNGAYPDSLHDRIGAMADRIAEAIHDGNDEVLIVGHSSGAHLAVSVLAHIMRRQPIPKGTPRVSLLTLGQVMPMVTFLPKAQGLRADLMAMAQQNDIFWLDVTAPGDSCCFALCDPAAVSGITPTPQTGPLIVSAAFRNTLSPNRYAALKWKFFRQHFQYLCSFDRPQGYDYFAITAGAKSLADRFGDRAPSKLRITTACNPYRSVT